MTAMFNIPTATSNGEKLDWETLDMASLPPVLAKQVLAIHEAQETLKAMKAKFAGEFNASFSEEVPAGMVRRFGYNFNGLSFANAAPNARKSGKAKVKFTARKGK